MSIVPPGPGHRICTGGAQKWQSEKRGKGFRRHGAELTEAISAATPVLDADDQRIVMGTYRLLAKDERGTELAVPEFKPQGECRMATKQIQIAGMTYVHCEKIGRAHV